MIVKLIKVARSVDQPAKLRDDVYALTRYVADADPWSLVMNDTDRVRSLAEYLRHAAVAGVEPGEKAGHLGTRNLLTGSLREQQLEMLATASAAPRVEFPLAHIIVSWREGEVPTPVQIDEAVDILLKATGLSRSPALYAEHTNTVCRHVHIAVVRVDKTTGGATGSEWLIEDMHQALAIIEDRQGWSSEPNALYYSREGAVFDARVASAISLADPDNQMPVTEVMVRDAAGHHVRTRDRDAVPADMRACTPVILAAATASRNWLDFHARLQGAGIAYERKGSGARVFVADKSAKASLISRQLSLATLEKAWGRFIPDPSRENSGFETYRAAHKLQLARLREGRTAAVTEICEWADLTIAGLPPQSSAALGTLIRRERDAAIRLLEAEYKTVIKACTDNRFTAAEAWAKAGSPAHPPLITAPALLLPVTAERKAHQPWTTPLRFEPDGWQVRYYDEDDRHLFTDCGSIIIVHRPQAADAIDNALLLAAARWDVVRVRGSVEFQQRCAERAAVMGVSLVDQSGRPLTIRALEPAPGVAPIQQPQPPLAVPDHRDDPARRVTIDRLLEDLQKMRSIPMHRGASDSSAGGAGRLTISAEPDPFDPQPVLKLAALLDEDERVQEFLQRYQDSMISNMERELVQWQVPLLRDDVVKFAEEIREGGGKAVYLAFDDPQFQAMLARVANLRRKWKQRDALAEKQRRQSARTRDVELSHGHAPANADAEMPMALPERGGIGD
ncbi:relaxase/mobilization nuclease domain-containing protein [Croceibacterium ferulae]|uniref:relaxase/mobilization nuclease domain-containing protein n=1 Tax=Croceibacterium ferulae TaxID=1854641 RepID=UPI000EB4DF1A|nr:relaxase/mobilization nuclease domain-containing protein [Croceibacterium ferulae]